MDYGGKGCAARVQDRSNARRLGVDIRACEFVPPPPDVANRTYPASFLEQRFGGLMDRVSGGPQWGAACMHVG